MNSAMKLEDGGLNLWPELEHPISRSMLKSFTEQLGIPTDRPIGSLSPVQRGYLLYGTGDQQFEVPETPKHRGFRFKYRGIYPALDIAGRTSPSLRMRLESFTDEVECVTCRGARVRAEAAHAKFRDRTIGELVAMPLQELHATVDQWKLDRREQKIASELKREILSRLSFLIEVGLGYLTIGRAANSLSGGEAQRIRLAGQLGSGLCGVLYVLDEPTIGLHPRDNYRLVNALKRLRDLGNTLIVVEHDRDVIAASDGLCDFGPGAGVEGGQIVAQGPPTKVAKIETSVTGPYLSGKKAIPVPIHRRIDPTDEVFLASKNPTNAPSALFKKSFEQVTSTSTTTTRSKRQNWLAIRGASSNTLRSVDVEIPLGTFVAVTGPSGSGKSSLINDCLYPALARRLHRANLKEGIYRGLEGIEHIDKVVRVDQSPLGVSPSSTPATYTGAFDVIRELFAKLPDSQVRGLRHGNLASMCLVGDVRSAKGTASVASKCISFPMSGSNVMHVSESDLRKRRCRCIIEARTSAMCST